MQLCSLCRSKLSGILRHVAGRILLSLQGPCCPPPPPATNRYIPDEVHLQSLTQEPQIPLMLASLAYTLWTDMAILIHITYYLMWTWNYVREAKGNVLLLETYKEMLRINASRIFRTFAAHEICSVASSQYCRKCFLFIVALRLQDHCVNDLPLRPM